MATNRLKEFREIAGLSMQALAGRVGTTAPQINKLEKGERRLTIDWLARLASGLGVEPRDLLPATEPLPARTPAIGAASLAAGVNLRDLIPVRSAARGGTDQEMFLQDGPIDHVPRPPSLASVADAYSIYMVGESMIPRFRPGQILHVNPFRPLRPGAGVVVTKTNDAVLIKEFVRRSETTLHLRQYNPDQPIEVPLAELRDVHTVVGLDEP